MDTLTNLGSARYFPTGATRDSAEGKPVYHEFLSPLVLEEYGRYMHRNRRQSDGRLRDGDNWQNGFGEDVLMSSGWRHFMAWWKGWWQAKWGGGRTEQQEADMREAACAIIFNVSAWLHEQLLNDQRRESQNEGLSALAALAAHGFFTDRQAESARSCVLDEADRRP